MPISLDGSGSISGISTFSFSDEIIHTGDTNTAIKFPANDTISFETSGNERFRITSAGSVGIGTNNPNVGNTAYPVCQVHGTSTNAYFKLTNTTTGVGSGDGVELSLSGSDAYLTNRESANIIFRTGGSNERLRITSGGDIQVDNGNVHIDDNGEFAIFEQDTSLAMTNSSKISMDFASNVARIRSSWNGSGVNAVGRPLAFFIGSSEKLRIKSDGKVGIGTDNPITNLDVRGASDASITIGLNNGTKYGNFSCDNSATYLYGYNGNDIIFSTHSGNSFNRKVTIKNGGQVLFSGLSANNDPRNLTGISVKSTGGVSFQNYGSNGSRNWRIRPDDMSRWGDLDFSVSPTANSATDWPDAAADKVLTLGYDGTVLKPRNPCFQAVVNGSHVSAGSYVVFGSADINIGNDYNTSNGIFTAPVAGVYLFHISSIAFNNASTVFRFFLKINNGNTGSGNDAHLRIDRTNHSAGSKYGTNASYTYYKYLNANDTARVYFAPDDNSASAYGGSDYFKFAGHLVG